MEVSERAASRCGDWGRRGNCPSDHRLLAAMDQRMKHRHGPTDHRLTLTIFDGVEIVVGAVGLDIELR